MQRLNIRYYTAYPVCNYACDYCIAGHGTVHNKPNINWSDERCTAIIDNIIKLPYQINIRLGVGGEFFISKTLVDGARKLSQSPNITSVNLITNLSFSIEQYEKIFEGYALEKIALVASFHPTEVKDHYEWFNKAATMNQRTDFAVVMVATPDKLQQLKDAKNYLNSLGVAVFVQAFIGTHNEKKYPQSYTPEERAFLRSIVYSRHDYEFMFELKKPGICNAGYEYLYVDPMGKVFPCGRGHYPNMLGDFSVSPTVRLRQAALPCPFQDCACDTENVNTQAFHSHYKHTGKNQHLYEYRFKDKAKADPRYDEWKINY